MSLSLISPRLFDPLVRSAGRDPDVEQASLRVIVCGVAFAYVCYLIASNGGLTPGLMLGLVASTSDAIVGMVMIAMLRHGFGRGQNMRYLGIIADNTALTLGIAGAGEGGVAMIGVYLWVTVGNGFRFGPRYLLVSYWFSLAGLAALCTFAPFWLQHRAVGAGLLLALAIVPLYVLVLLSRLTAQKDAAEQLSNAKSRFVANVSHELRTPLTGIAAVYDLLRMRNLRPEESELVGMLGNALKTLKSSVDAVLQMSKLEAGAERASNVPFNLPYFLQLLSEIVKPQSTVKNVAWRLDVDPAVMQTVIGDPGHLSHVLGNLLNNAFKFTSRGGVTLRVRTSTPGRVRFDVIDTGIGIPADKQEHLFERFVQADNSATRRYGGTGLGTSIARDLTELMGGSIGVVSEPGKGSTFWVDLPLGEYRDADWSLPASETRREVLLICNDGDLVASELSRQLCEIGFTARVQRRDSVAPHFDVQRYFAAFVVMSAADAAHTAAAGLERNSGPTCPWIAVTEQCSGSQISTLASLGASAVMNTSSFGTVLRSTLAGLANRIDVPAADGEPVPGVRTPSKAAFRVLVADDNKSIQLLLGKILQGAEHHVRTAERGDEAFDLMASGEIDIAILDLNMPEMSGPDVVKLFRASSSGASNRLPIIVLSADATPAARDESLLAGADAFLTKPVSSVTLLSMIEKLVPSSSFNADAHAKPTKHHETLNVDRPASAVECQSSNLVDFERINAVKAIARSDAAFLDKYLAAAFSEVSVAIDQLRTALSDQDTRCARDALHIIEGTAASVGATGVVANCKDIRARLATDDEWNYQASLAELSTSHALSKSTILAAVDRAPHSARNRLPQRHG